MSTVSARSMDGKEVTLGGDVIEDLRNRLRGSLMVPGDPDFDKSRSVWNGMIDRQPGLIIQCLGVADVVTGVNFAREHGILLSVKGGGHNISGLAVCDGGLMLDMSLRRGVWVDSTARIAYAQSGCILGDVDRETQLHGLASCLGFVSKTGIAGLTLGGGFGYLSRRCGWTSDTVLSMEVVTANGQIVRASEREHPDLFWGLRGGGGNFGVVTNIEYQLFPVGPEIVGGAVAWRGEDAPAVLELFRTLTSEAPPELTVVAVMRLAPPAPWLPKEVHGKLIAALFVCYSGSVDEGERVVAPIKVFGSPVGDILQRRSYVSQQSILDATQPEGRRYYWKSEYLPGHQPELLSKVIEHAGSIVSPHSGILVFPLDGALNRLPEDHSAVGNRETKSVVNITASWESASDDKANIDWARNAWEDMRQFSTGGTYLNFLTEEETDERLHDAFRKNYDRLGDVKAQWDPTNLFRVNKNIAPRKA